jgi:uncharacterized integral membrane protein (TIGR00698 family)
LDQIRPAKGLSDPYANPELFEGLDSLEGVPDWLGPGETDLEREGWAPWQRVGNRLFARGGANLPGLALALLIASGGRLISEIPALAFGLDKTPVSPILVAILLGLFVRNTVGLPSIYEEGLQLALKRILRIGVALLGIRLSLAAAGTIGLIALPIVIVCIATALLFVTRLGAMVGLPPRLSTLIAVGTAICGNSAIVAIAPVIDARDDEVSYAVGCVTLFGLIALLVYPYLGHYLFDGEPTLVGLFLGTAIHDTAQVAGAGMVYLAQFGTPEVLDSATVTKLQRNMFMLVVIPLMALRSQSRRSTGTLASQVRAAIPFFVFGFLAMSLLRTLGDWGDQPFGLLSADTWQGIIAFATQTATVCLAVAMAAVGLGTSFSRLRGLGLRPLAVGFAAAALVGIVSFLLVWTIGDYGLI